jgi:hypothetical protein
MALFVESAGIAKREQRPVRQAPVEYQPGSTQRAIRDHHLAPADAVVYDLMPIHYSQRIGPGISPPFESEHKVIWSQPGTGIFRVQILGREKRRYGVARKVGEYVGRSNGPLTPGDGRKRFVVRCDGTFAR